jgi:hypothetical protein
VKSSRCVSFFSNVPRVSNSSVQHQVLHGLSILVVHGLVYCM